MHVCCLLLLSFQISYAQVDVIEIDSITRSAVRTAPFDKPFLIKTPIEAEGVKRVFLIQRAGRRTLYETINHYISTAGPGYQVPRLEPNYFWTRKIGDKNYLFISIADKYLFKPSESYFILPDLRQSDPSVIAFFDAFYQHTLAGGAPGPALTSARNHLERFDQQMRRIFGDNLIFGFMTLAHFDANMAAFTSAFNTIVLPTYVLYDANKTAFGTGLPARVALLSANWPVFTAVTRRQLQLDATLNKEAIAYLSGKDYSKNDMIADLTAAGAAGLTADLLSGVRGLHCVRCEPLNINSNTVRDLSKRTANLDSSVRYLGQLQRALYLLTPTGDASVAASLTSIEVWIAQLQTSRGLLENMIQQRKTIEDKIMDNYFDGMGFTYTQVLGGNTYLNFETRNKLLLTPDFGVVTPSISGEGKGLDYGIIPYLGFHVNLMAVDKDIVYKSYRKHLLQRLSLMVGWSLVNLAKADKYDNFFEKSALLTGAGYRLNNVIRITTGAAWLFRLGVDQRGDPTRKLKAAPYLGLSFDLNIKQYLNGFTDLLSGIGKTKPTITTTQQ